MAQLKSVGWSAKMRLPQVTTAVALVMLALCTTTQTVQAEKSRLQQKIDLARFCDDLKDAYDTNMAYYNENPSKRSRWKATAENIKTLAEGNNCGWATGMAGSSGLGNGPTDDPQVGPANEETPSLSGEPLGTSDAAKGGKRLPPALAGNSRLLPIRAL